VNGIHEVGGSIPPGSTKIPSHTGRLTLGQITIRRALTGNRLRQLAVCF
jgi:hypothetical protein